MITRSKRVTLKDGRVVFRRPLSPEIRAWRALKIDDRRRLGLLVGLLEMVERGELRMMPGVGDDEPKFCLPAMDESSRELW